MNEYICKFCEQNFELEKVKIGDYVEIQGIEKNGNSLMFYGKVVCKTDYLVTIEHPKGSAKETPLQIEFDPSRRSISNMKVKIYDYSRKNKKTEEPIRE